MAYNFFGFYNSLSNGTRKVYKPPYTSKNKALKYDCFRIYGLSINFPFTWKIELNPKSTRERGDVAFKSDDGKKIIFLSWGNLEKAKKKYSSLREQVEACFKRMKKSPEIENVELIKSETLEINSHEADFNYVKVTRAKYGFFSKKTYQRDVLSVHLYCNHSNRFIVIYGSTDPESFSEYIEIFKTVMKSLICH